MFSKFILLPVPESASYGFLLDPKHIYFILPPEYILLQTVKKVFFLIKKEKHFCLKLYSPKIVKKLRGVS